MISFGGDAKNLSFYELIFGEEKRIKNNVFWKWILFAKCKKSLVRHKE